MTVSSSSRCSRSPPATPRAASAARPGSTTSPQPVERARSGVDVQLPDPGVEPGLRLVLDRLQLLQRRAQRDVPGERPVEVVRELLGGGRGGVQVRLQGGQRRSRLRLRVGAEGGERQRGHQDGRAQPSARAPSPRHPCVLDRCGPPVEPPYGR